MNIIGQKIIRIRDMTVNEQEECGYEHVTAVIELENGVQIYAQKDEENNGPGVLAAYDPSDEKCDVILL